MDFKSRDEIEEQYQWDLSTIYPSDELFLAALRKAKAYPEQCAAWQGIATSSAEKLLQYLQFQDEIDEALIHLDNYAERKHDQDTRVSRYQDFASQVMHLYVAISSANAWFVPELLSLPDEQINHYYSACPGLEQYRRLLERQLCYRDHTLSPAEESLLAAAGEMAQQPDNIFSMLNDADLTFPDAIDSKGEHHSVTHGSFVPLLNQQDRVLRKSAFESLYSVYYQFRNTSASILSAQTKQLKFFAEARKYPSTLTSALYANEVPVSVYTNLIDAVRSNLAALHKYTQLRRNLLRVDVLHFYDLYVPMVADIDMHFTYEEACNAILKALEPMGEEYCSIVKKGLSARWIDVYEIPGKRSGAYSSGGYGMNPFILMNFHGTLNDVFTLIHEMGHSVHTYLSCQNQPVCYSNYVIFVAEVASTCNEALLMQYLLKTTTEKRKRAYLLNYFLEQFRTTLYRQTMFAEFELKINQITERGEGITADTLCNLYRQLNADYFGSAIEIDDEIALEWARIPHFYYNYYVYQYATGYAAAIALSEKILTEGEPAVNKYLNFLKSGSSLPPIDLLRSAGVDMATAQPINEALAIFDRLIDEMNELAKV